MLPAQEKGKWLIGTINIRWGVKELVKIYSSEKSYFAKKRIESGVAFLILQWGMIYFLINKIHADKMDTMDMLMWAGVEATICGYMIQKIEKDNISHQANCLANKVEDNKQTNIVNNKESAKSNIENSVTINENR